MLNDQRISEKELYDLRTKICRVVENDLETLSAEMEKSNVYPLEMWEIGKKNDTFHLSLPIQCGGMGLYLEQYFTVLEEIGRGNQVIRMFLHVTNGLNREIMVEHGTEEMKNEHLPKMGTGDFFVALALIEPDCGSSVGIRSTVIKKGDKWVLNGRKTLISFTDICGAYYVTAVSDEEKCKRGGYTAFYVSTDTKGLRVENMPHMMGCRGTGHGDVVTEDMEIPDEYRLGAEGEELTVFLHAPAVSRASTDVCLLGLSQRMSELAIVRVRDRVTFGKVLIQRQAVQQMLTDMAVQAHALRLLIRNCAQKVDRDEDIEMISSMTKLHGIDMVCTVSDGCLEVFDEIGYFEDNPYGPVERLYRDARTMWSEEGPRTVQRPTLVRKVIDADGETRTSNYC